MAEVVFMGICLEADKKYEEILDRSVRLSMAAIDPSKCKDNTPITVYMKNQEVEYVLCTLVPGTLNQQQLDLNFAVNEEVELYIKGKGTVYITGYHEDLMNDYDYDDEEEEGEESEDEEEEEEEEVEAVKGKRKLPQIAPASKKVKFEVEEPKKKAEPEVKGKKQNAAEKQQKPVPVAQPQAPVNGDKKKNKKKNKKNKQKN